MRYLETQCQMLLGLQWGMISIVIGMCWTSPASQEVIQEIIDVKQRTGVEREHWMNLSMSFVSTVLSSLWFMVPYASQCTYQLKVKPALLLCRRVVPTCKYMYTKPCWWKFFKLYIFLDRKLWSGGKMFCCYIYFKFGWDQYIASLFWLFPWIFWPANRNKHVE